MKHLLDRPVWSALGTRHASLAEEALWRDDTRLQSLRSLQLKMRVRKACKLWRSWHRRVSIFCCLWRTRSSHHLTS